MVYGNWRGGGGAGPAHVCQAEAPCNPWALLAASPVALPDASQLHAHAARLESAQVAWSCRSGAHWLALAAGGSSWEAAGLQKHTCVTRLHCCSLRIELLAIGS